MTNPNTAQTILFLAANPIGTPRLRLDQELRDISEGLQRAQKRDRFNLEQRLAVRPQDIRRAMLDLNPQIIHFSGHGEGEAGLVFEDEIGNSRLVNGDALAALFELFADRLNCVVLNGCYSEVQAQAIAQHIPYVIGMNNAIGDRAAITFAVGFYDALGAGRDVEFAFRLGCAAIRMQGIPEHLTPVLKEKPQNPHPVMPSQELDALVEQTRQAIERRIRNRCGTLRVLDMQRPFEMMGEDGIYTNVNILELPTSLSSVEDVFSVSLNNQSLYNNRFGLGNIIERSPGLEVVDRYPQLLVLGKPGAGKTTFLKYIAIQCISGEFQENKVPFFVNLRDFAHDNQQPNIIEYLARLIPSDRIQLFEGENSVEIVRLLLQEGRCLVLLDGLDEVHLEDTGRINREIRNAADEFDRSQFVITCRIAAQEYVFERFTAVEVADFDNLQIQTFAGNWFRARFESQGANYFEPRLLRFNQRLKEDRSIRELASNPLLLTLMCFVFSEYGNFPQRRADLYEQGLNILLRRWDASHNIDQYVHYQYLDVQRREDLLSFVAFQTFSRGELIVQGSRIRNYISDYLRNLNNLGYEIQGEDSEVVLRSILRSIQAQHGLLVERAMGVYSFSHLTLQEYFVAREINLTNQPEKQRKLLKLLAEKFSDSRWREVLLLMMEMSRDASDLLLEIKREIDSPIANDRRLQEFLQWVDEKSRSVAERYQINNLAVRAFYCAITLSLVSEFAWQIDSTFDSNSNFDLKLDNLLIIALNRATADACLDLHLELKNVIDHINNNDNYDDLRNELNKLYNRLPGKQSNSRVLTKWKKDNGQRWVKDLRKCTFNNRNIGLDFKFSDEQRRVLQKYHNSSLFLLECLNTDCYVDNEVRAYIEETLLLPVKYKKMKFERILKKLYYFLSNINRKIRLMI